MSSKSKWDQPAAGDDAAPKPPKDEGRTASEAAAAAAAIAAKIAAQFANGSLGLDSGQKDMHDAEFTSDIDINDVRNRYLLTKGSTQDQVSLFFIYDGGMEIIALFLDSRGNWCFSRNEGCMVSRSE